MALDRWPPEEKLNLALLELQRNTREIQELTAYATSMLLRLKGGTDGSSQKCLFGTRKSLRANRTQRH